VRSKLALYAALLVCTGAWASGPGDKDSPLENYIAELKRNNPQSDGRLSLAAVGAAKNGHLFLSFRLKNVSTKSITISSAALPWGNTYAIQFVALTPRGQILPLGYPFDDVFGAPSVTTIHPGEILTGD
jgi:hypothetical protein